MTRLIVALFIWISACGNVIAAENIVAVKIYYVDWNLFFRQAQKPEDIRRLPSITTSIVDADEISKFIKFLELGKLKSSPKGGAKSDDARLVIDLIGKNGGKTTYYVGRFYFLSEDGSKWKEADPVFKSHFFSFDPKEQEGESTSR